MNRTNDRNGSKRKSDIFTSSDENTLASRTNNGTGSKRKLDLDTSRAVPVKFSVTLMMNQVLPIEMMSSDRVCDIKEKILENAVLKVMTPDGMEILSYQMPQRFAEWGREKLPSTFCLMFDGKRIPEYTTDTTTLSDMGISDGATINLMQCLCGC